MRGRPARRPDCHPERKHKGDGLCVSCYFERKRVSQKIFDSLGKDRTLSKEAQAREQAMKQWWYFVGRWRSVGRTAITADLTILTESETPLLEESEES